MGIYDEFISTGKWGETQILLGMEFKFKCAYCDKNLLGCVDSHSEWQTDHIIPSSKGGCDTIENFALCCRTCNFIKGKWNPSDFLGEQNLTKESLIKAVRIHISERRKQMQKDIDLYTAIVAKHC